MTSSSLAFFFFQAFFLDEAGDSAIGFEVMGDDIVVVWAVENVCVKVDSENDDEAMPKPPIVGTDCTVKP